MLALHGLLTDTKLQPGTTAPITAFRDGSGAWGQLRFLLVKERESEPERGTEPKPVALRERQLPERGLVGKGSPRPLGGVSFAPAPRVRGLRDLADVSAWLR